MAGYADDWSMSNNAIDASLSERLHAYATNAAYLQNNPKKGSETWKSMNCRPTAWNHLQTEQVEVHYFS